MSTTYQPAHAPEASTAELLARLSEQTSRLVRDEMRLAQRELQQSARHAGAGAGLLGAAGLFAGFGLAALVASAIAALALVLPVWASALIVAGGLFVIAAAVALVSRSQAKKVPPPAAESIDSIKRDAAEVAEKVKDARR
jgi:Flp pilus assembly protein TadB